MPILLSGRELADRLGATYADVMYWQRSGIIPAIRVGTRKIVFNLEAVVESLRDHQRSTSAREPETVGA